MCSFLFSYRVRVRFAAIEFLMTLTEALPSSIAKIHDFIPSVLHMLITWLFTYEAESNWEDSVVSDSLFLFSFFFKKRKNEFMVHFYRIVLRS